MCFEVSKPLDMKKSITICIPEPCHEDWQKMTPTEKGKFCKVCTKEVVDFTAKTDEDLVKILSKGNATCGRFKKSQLNREMKLERKSGLNLAPYAASLLLPLSLLSTSEINSRSIDVSEKPYSSLGVGKFSSPNRALITTSGVIKDENGVPTANVEITSNESQKTAVSDSEGNYTITALDHEILVFQKESFQMHEVRTSGFSEIRDITLFSIIPSHMIVGKMLPQPIAPEEILTGDVISLTTVETTIEEVEEATIIKITGTVTDETGLELPGVNIVVKGTTTGTLTDFNGNYEIEAEAGLVLTFSFLGFTTEEITLSNISNTINLKMEESISGGISMGIVIYGGEQYIKPQTKEERKTESNTQKAAHKNEIEYTKIKKARKKVARILKRSKKGK